MLQQGQVQGGACNLFHSCEKASHEISSGCLSQLGLYMSMVVAFVADLRRSSNRAPLPHYPALTSLAMSAVSQPAYEPAQVHEMTQGRPEPEQFSGGTLASTARDHRLPPKLREKKAGELLSVPSHAGQQVDPF